MASGSFKQADVLCPFYRSDDGRSTIQCEGLTDQSSIRLVFGRKHDYEIQINTFCCGRYKCCEICSALSSLWEDDGKEIQ